MAQISWKEVADKIWSAVEQKHQNQLNDWIQCFGSTQPSCIQQAKDFAVSRKDGKETGTLERQAKDEIVQSLSDKSNQNDGRVNFILRLIRDDEYAYFHYEKNGQMQHLPKVQLALAFLTAMTQLPECSSFINVTLNIVQMSNKNGSAVENKSRGNTIIHELAKCGFYAQFENYCSHASVTRKNSVNETPLHLAAEVGNKHDIELLLKKGATLEADSDGCTPLHSAAVAICPDHDIAELLVNAARHEQYHLLLNYTSTSEENTALHLAAGNVNITQDFISQLKDADPQRQNAFNDTPFHVAAKSSNPKAVVYMLTTFSPLRDGWDVDDVERNRDPEQYPSLLTICATSGNAEAVALMIQNGADISKGILHEIVLESVKQPEKIDNLLAVYRAVVDNAVTWKCLEQNRKTFMRGSQRYKECLKETMMSLIAMRVTVRPSKKPREVDVLEHAIECGASQMFQEIINTEDVFRTTIDEKSLSYDVANFTRATSNWPKKKMTYLEYFLLNYDRWVDTEIFKSEPIATLIKPYILISQIWCFVFGLVQLMLMVLISILYVPHTCFFEDTLNLSLSNTSTHNDCLWNVEYACSSSNVMNHNLSHNFTNDACLHVADVKTSWFVRSIMIAVGGLLGGHVGVILTTELRYTIRFTATKNVGTWFTKTLLFLLQTVPHAAFYTFLVVWLALFNNVNRYVYYQFSSMLLLFGWISTLLSFGGIRKELSVFTKLLNEVIVIDIMQRFFPVFGLIVLAFSFALHILRVAVLPNEQYHRFSITTYDVFTASLGIGGELAANVRDGVPSLFAVVFLTYMFLTAIILINVLIAMISNRYELAKQRAENSWRYKMIATGLLFERECKCILMVEKIRYKNETKKRVDRWKAFT